MFSSSWWQFNIPPQVAIEENNRNTLTQLSKFKKFQSQISEDFTKQFSVLEKLLDEFTTGAGKGKEKADDTFCFGKSENCHRFVFRDKEVDSGGEKGAGEQLQGQQ